MGNASARSNIIDIPPSAVVQRQAGRSHQERQPYYLMFGGPATNFQSTAETRFRGNGLPLIFYVDPQQTAAPRPEVQNMQTVRTAATFRKSSATVTPAPDGATLSFTLDAVAPSLVTVYVGVNVSVNSSGLAFRPIAPHLPFPLCSFPVEPGANQTVTVPQSIPVHLLSGANALTHDSSHPTIAPIVVAVAAVAHQAPATVVPAAVPGALQAQTTASVPQVEATVLSLIPTAAPAGAAAGAAAASYTVRPISRQLQVKTDVYSIDDIYGADDTGGGAAGGGEGAAADADDDDGAECVVCMMADRDTTVMPCRHMCLCADCAEILRRQTNKCPVCRTTIERLLTVKRPTQSQAQPTAQPTDGGAAAAAPAPSGDVGGGAAAAVGLPPGVGAPAGVGARASRPSERRTTAAEGEG